MKNLSSLPLSTIENFEIKQNLPYFSNNVNDLLSLGAGSLSSDDEISREKMAKKIPSEEHSPFYLTGASVDMPDDGMDEDSFQVSAEFYIPLHSSKCYYITRKNQYIL